MTNIAALKADFETKFAAAKKAQSALIAAQNKAGLHAPKQFWLWGEVKELLDDERVGWTAIVYDMASPAQRKQSAFTELAALVKTHPEIAKLYSDPPELKPKGKK